MVGGATRTGQGIVPAMALSDATLRTLKATHKDDKVSSAGGLFLLIKARGSKSWRVKYRSGGKEKLLVIGNDPAVSLAQARATRDAANAALAGDEGLAQTQAGTVQKTALLPYGM